MVKKCESANSTPSRYINQRRSYKPSR
jgi:hypothetical protein